MPRGFVYRVAQGGDVEVLRGVAPQGVRVANGCAFSECGSSMGATGSLVYHWMHAPPLRV